MRLLELRRVTVRRGTCPVIDGVSLQLNAGEFVGLLGPNGAGKTTLMRAALGLIAAEGIIKLEDVLLDAIPLRQRALSAAYLPQEREIAWPLAVEALVALGRHPHRGRGAAPSASDRAAVENALARADVLHLRDRTSTELSGGERARILVARALAQRAPLLLADEPTAGLDPAHAIGLMETFASIAGEGRGVLVSLHDLSLAARHCHRLVLMKAGRIVADGPPEMVLSPERLADTFGVAAYIASDSGGPIVVPTGRTGT